MTFLIVTQNQSWTTSIVCLFYSVAPVPLNWLLFCLYVTFFITKDTQHHIVCLCLHEAPPAVRLTDVFLVCVCKWGSEGERVKRDATGEDDYLHSGEKTCELISCKYFYVVVMSVWEAVFSFAHFFCLSASYDSILCVCLPFWSLSSCFDSLKLYLHFNWDPLFPVF